MSTATAISIPAPRQELAFRTSGGLEITLYWDAEEQTTGVEVHQPATQETFLFTVPEEDALDAFHHPFAHLERANARRLTTVPRSPRSARSQGDEQP